MSRARTVAALCSVLALPAIAGPRNDQPARAVGVYEPWNVLAQNLPAAMLGNKPLVRPVGGRQVLLDVSKLQSQLAGAPRENDIAFAMAAAPVVIAVPRPDGKLERFEIFESPVYEPGFEAEFPDMKTYRGDSIETPGATIRCDLTPLGFRAQVLSPEGSYWLDPVSIDDTNLYTSYARSDLGKSPPWKCGVHGTNPDPIPENIFEDRLAVGPTRRNYRIAVAATGEYTAYFGGTVTKGQAAIVSAINRVTQVYEQELNIRLTLVANNSSLVYTNASSDPYSNSDSESLLAQNQATVVSKIGSANFDIGHVFSTDGGGLAGLGVVCNSSRKAQGETGSSSPNGDAFWIDYVAHEIGHQFGANHSFNGTLGSCDGNREASRAHEPGSGSTIMAYAGICDADDLQAHSDPYFHAVNFYEIITYVSSNSCHTATATNNATPTVSAGAAATIPKGTPYTLTATGADANGDALTYCWEMYFAANAQNPSGGNFPDTGTNGPFQRSWSPTTSPSRQLPLNSKLLANTLAFGETLPLYSRVLPYRVTVRDGKGGVNSADVKITVTSTSGPFDVTSQSSNTSWTAGTTQAITWSVANTTAAPVSCSKVDILFAADGADFSTTLASGVPNSGSANIVVPYVPTSSGRVKVKGTGKIFFDINRGRITITGSPLPPTNAKATPDSVCPNTTFVLSCDPAPANSSIKWYTGSCGGSLVGTGNSLTLPRPASSTTYFARTVSADNKTSTCVSVAVQAASSPVTPGSISSSLSRACKYQTGGTITLTANGGSGTTLRWFSGSCGGTQIGSSLTDKFITIPVPTKTTTYFARYENNCGVSDCVSITIPFTECMGDLNCDGKVDDTDFIIFLPAYYLYGCTNPNMPAGCPADVVRNGYVDDDDLNQFLISYDRLICP